MLTFQPFILQKLKIENEPLKILPMLRLTYVSAFSISSFSQLSKNIETCYSGEYLVPCQTFRVQFFFDNH